MKYPSGEIGMPEPPSASSGPRPWVKRLSTHGESSSFPEMTTAARRLAACRTTARPGGERSGGGAGGVKEHADRETAAKTAKYAGVKSSMREK